LKTVELGSRNKEPYLACPYCLTEISTERSAISKMSGEGSETACNEDAEGSSSASEVSASEPQNEMGCVHHFGYLRERPKGEAVSEKCMTCAKMVDCMVTSAKRTDSGSH
jgi:hypothetical protein